MMEPSSSSSSSRKRKTTEENGEIEKEGEPSNANAATNTIGGEEQQWFGVPSSQIHLLVDVLQKLAPHANDVANDTRFRPFRLALQPFMQEVVSKFRTKKHKEHFPVKKAEEKRKKAQDKELVNSARMRAERIAKKQQFIKQLEETEGKEEAEAEMRYAQLQAAHLMIADGPVESKPAAIADDDGDDGDDGDEKMEDTTNSSNNNANEPRILNKSRRCYICHEDFTQLHHFYADMCLDCGDFNYQKRLQTVDMKDRVVLLTGARVKIGYQCGLILLRCGATLIATSRFPADCIKRYQDEPDFESWKDKLHVYALDLRDLQQLEAFCEFVKGHYSRLDALINNACQTVRRPPAYYQHLLEGEKTAAVAASSSNMANMLHWNEDFRETVRAKAVKTLTSSDKGQATIENNSNTSNNKEDISSNNNRDDEDFVEATPAVMSQMALVEGDHTYDKEMFPDRVYDASGQQLDLRTKNSWTSRIDEVAPVEAAEVVAINTLAPFMLIGKLRPLMEKDTSSNYKFVINVSAMEGKFSRYKSPFHPHTNMAKAALNMITRTCGRDLSGSNILINSVDTGWINDENPVVQAAQRAANNNFQTPLDEIDAAARILDPIMCVIKGDDPVYGMFFKDYKNTLW